MKKRSDTLGRPAPDEDKDQNMEQLKSRRGAAAMPPPHAGRRKEAERVDPTERTRAGERQ